MKKITKSVLFCLSLSMLVVGCDTKDDESPALKLTPDEHKAKIEQTGMNLLSKINADDHKELLQTATSFVDLADEYELMIEEDLLPNSVMIIIKQVCMRSSATAMASFTSTESELYKLSQHFGIYTANPQNRTWDFKEDNSKLAFHFMSDGKAAAIQITCSEKSTIVEVDDETQVEIPELVTLQITRDSKEVANLTVTSSINNGEKKAKAQAQLKINAYTWTAVLDMTPAKASSSFLMKKGEELLIMGEAQLNGNGLTDHPEEQENIEDLFSTADLQCNILNEISIQGSCSNIKSMVKEIDRIQLDKDTKAYAEAEAKITNKYLAMNMRYAGFNDVIASISTQAYLADSWSWSGETYEYWDIEPVLIFAIDGSKYSFETYFNEADFSGLVKSAENLFKAYEKIINN